MRKAAKFVFAIFVLLTLTSPMSAAFAQQGLKDRIVGTWKIVSWESLRPDGRAVNIWMGAHPTGVIMYQPNGYMAVQIMADPRPTFAQNPATSSSSNDEFRNAFFGYYAYWGTYTINDAGNGVTHNVQASERPAEVGMKYARSVSIDGTKLIITTPSYKAGLLIPRDVLERAQVPADEELVNRLTFERIE
jgi:Lipocalin-like domain